MKILLLSLLVGLVSYSYAGVYKWTDEHGRVHFGDSPPQNEVSKEITVSVNTYTSVSFDASSFDTHGQLVFYTKNDCGYCKKARKYMDSVGIIYDERNLDHSRAARLQHKRLGADGVPVFLKDKRRMNGYNEKNFANFVKEDEIIN